MREQLQNTKLSSMIFNTTILRICTFYHLYNTGAYTLLGRSTVGKKFFLDILGSHLKI